MIAVIRISGQVDLKKEIAETLQRLNLDRKYTCVVFENPNASQMGMIKILRDFVAYGEISEETFKKMKDARGKEGKKTFRLHPPRKGIDSKKHFGTSRKAVLGDNKDKINELIERML